MRRRWIATGLLLAVLAAGTGCVERKMVITSDPPGAVVTVNQQWVRKTPCTIPFKHYGVYDIRLEKPGYHPLHVKEPIRAPAYQKAGADFPSEVLYPGTIKDVHERHYALKKIEEDTPIEEIIANSQAMKSDMEEIKALRKKRDEERVLKTPDLPLPEREEQEERRKDERKQREAEKKAAQEKAQQETPASPAPQPNPDAKEKEATPPTAEPMPDVAPADRLEGSL